MTDRLQPALLDRLMAGEPGSGADDGQHVMSRAQIRAAVLRDLTWLLNAVQPLSAELAARFPEAARSVVNYGLPPLSGLTASRVEPSVLEGMLRDAIVCFEPRVVGDESLVVRALKSSSLLDTHNVIEFEIRGFVWAQPVPLELLLRTELDLELGQVQVHDLAGRSPLPMSSIST